MFKEALLGCSAIVGVGAFAMLPEHAIAQSATIVRTGSIYADMALANAAAIKGDTINVAPGTLLINGTFGLHEPEFFVETDVKFNCTGSVGAGPGPSRGCVLSSDMAHSYSPGWIAGISKGLMIIGHSNEMPNVTVDGFAFEHAIQVVCGLTTTCTDNIFNTGRTAAPGFLWQLVGQANAAGIRYQSGNLTVRNSYFDQDENGILAAPFIDGTGTIDVASSIFEETGAGSGTEHGLYIGRVAKFIANGITSWKCYAGIDLKVRAINQQIGMTTGNTLGSSSTLDYSADQYQAPDGGHIDFQNNVLTKGQNSGGSAGGVTGNPWIVSVGGFVMPWATPVEGGSYFHAYHNTLLADSTLKVNGYFWNAMPNAGTNLVSGTYDVDIQSNVLGGTVPKTLILAGLGNQSNNVNSNGTTIAGGLVTIPGLPPNSGGTFATILDFSGSIGPQSITQTGGQLAIGGSGALTSTSTSCSGCGVLFGSGGGTLSSFGVATSIPFADTPTAGPVVASAQIPIDGEVFGNGGTFSSNASNAANNYLEIGGQNVNYFACTPPAAPKVAGGCGSFDMKHGVGSISPSATYNARGGYIIANMIQSGNGTILGTAEQMHLKQYSDPASSTGPAVWNLNITFQPFGTRTYAPFVLTGSIFGQAVEITGPNSSSGGFSGVMLSYADSQHQNVWYPGIGPWDIYMADDTVVFGSSTAIARGLSGAKTCSLYPELDEAFVPGSGNAIANIGCPPTVIEVIKGQGSGILTLNSYKANPVTFLGYTTPPSLVTTVNGSNETVVVSNGPTLVLASFTGAINTVAPTGSGSMTLAMGSAQTMAVGSSAALTGLSVTDTFAGSFAGLLDLNLIPSGGTVIANGQTTGPGGTMIVQGTLGSITSVLSAATWIAGQSNGSLVETLWDQAGVRQTGTKSIIVSGAASNDMTLSLVNGPFTIVPGGSVSVDVALTDQFASGTAGTLSATVSLQTAGQIIFNGTTETSSGNDPLTFTVGESYAAMQTDLAALGYIGVSNPGQNDVISISVTNQGTFSQTITVPVVSLAQADMTLQVPATDTSTANVLDNIGTLIAITDGYAAGQTDPNFIFTANTDSGTLFVNGTPQPNGISFSDTFSNVITQINLIGFEGTQASTATIQWSATNQGGFSQSGSTIETVLAQGTTNDTTITFPRQITITALGSITFQGVSIKDLYGQTSTGPVTLLASATSGKTVFNGATLNPGQTGTLIDTLPNVNSILAGGGFGYIAPGTTVCDGVVLSFTNQGPFTTTKTISANTTIAAFGLSGPASETVAANGTIDVPITLTDTSGLLGNDSVGITSSTGTVIFGGQVHSPPVSFTLNAPPNVLAGLLSGMQYVAAAGPGTDTITATATSIGGGQISQFTIPTTITTGPAGICPIPP